MQLRTAQVKFLLVLLDFKLPLQRAQRLALFFGLRTHALGTVATAAAGVHLQFQFTLLRDNVQF